VKISVAMATFNGERFLAEQLASIAAQSRLPDEVVICDDASTDGTVAIAAAFSKGANLRVRVERNPERLGTAKNFEKAIRLCEGDVVVLADQDDVWLPRKVEVLEAAFQRDEDCVFAFSDAEVVDENLTPLGHRLWDAIGFSRRQQQRLRDGEAFAELLRRPLVTGATLAFRREAFKSIPPGWMHDEWIAIRLSEMGRCAVIEEPLILYRQHARQQIGGTKRSWLERYRDAQSITAETYRGVSARFEEFSKFEDVMPEHMRGAAEKAAHFARRSHMRQAGVWRLPRILAELARGRYFRYSRGLASAAQDALLS
jgi:glycosyltransferase involved in cell wall biosynthesis